MSHNVAKEILFKINCTGTREEWKRKEKKKKRRREEGNKGMTLLL